MRLRAFYRKASDEILKSKQKQKPRKRVPKGLGLHPRKRSFLPYLTETPLNEGVSTPFAAAREGACNGL
eukprot:4132847-Pleurochrysis_carterae.AAC.1